MPGRGRSYPPESKTEAVEPYRNSDRSIRDIAGELGIAPESLRRWNAPQMIGPGKRIVVITQERDEFLLARASRARGRDEAGGRLLVPQLPRRLATGGRRNIVGQSSRRLSRHRWTPQLLVPPEWRLPQGLDTTVDEIARAVEQGGEARRTLEGAPRDS